jgi:hypothetical protein
MNSDFGSCTESSITHCSCSTHSKFHTNVPSCSNVSQSTILNTQMFSSHECDNEVKLNLTNEDEDLINEYRHDMSISATPTCPVANVECKPHSSSNFDCDSNISHNAVTKEVKQISSVTARACPGTDVTSRTCPGTREPNTLNYPGALPSESKAEMNSDFVQCLQVPEKKCNPILAHKTPIALLKLPKHNVIREFQKEQCLVIPLRRSNSNISLNVPPRLDLLEMNKTQTRSYFPRNSKMRTSHDVKPHQPSMKCPGIRDHNVQVQIKSPIDVERKPISVTKRKPLNIIKPACQIENSKQRPRIQVQCLLSNCSCANMKKPTNNSCTCDQVNVVKTEECLGALSNENPKKYEIAHSIELPSQDTEFQSPHLTSNVNVINEPCYILPVHENPFECLRLKETEPEEDSNLQETPRFSEVSLFEIDQNYSCEKEMSKKMPRTRPVSSSPKLHRHTHISIHSETGMPNS